MKKKRETRISNMAMGADASFLLAVTLPLVLIQLAYAVTYTASLDYYTRMAEWETVCAAFENVLMSLLLSLAGSLLYDVADKKDSCENGK